ncbi:hybrid sensor histidine kinase/response regulator [Actinoplanes sp. ATCC 53533]|uniref:ATP-binding protein n=1 Tax=Actinoplanes sp. ATCC 53533 TaxID=1288362 RepID=UPI000F7B0167|nr:ATP-binding protein [Actinoplanes sp. ATCC 53533]RSM43073.1 hybrid sensor histidine kinase/response regulator [Actinoplanes sp. ATCC 53533]
MQSATHTLVEAIPGPAAIVDQDGQVLLANRRWAGQSGAGGAFPAEGAWLAGGAGPCPAHEQLLSAVRRMSPTAEPAVLPCRCAPETTATVQVTHLASDYGPHRRLITVLAEPGRGTGPDPGPDTAAEAKSQFLALLGHEIRTPLTTVVATVDLLRAQPMQQDAREIVDSVYRSMHGLKTLADDLLDLARLETGELRVRHEPLEPRLVLESVVEPLQQQARRKSILLLSAPAPELPALVLGDPDRLRQVVTAVVGNAVKFTEAGEVVVTAAPDGDDAYLITVSDTGPGIADPDRTRIFAPFVQADSSASRRHEGAGLGLALAARLVAGMGGTIDVRSQPGAGAEFLIRLPLQAAPQQPPRPEPPLHRRRVGVVAPAPRSTLALSWLLRGAGAEPVPMLLTEVAGRASEVDTVLWCDDAHDPDAVGRADAVGAALGPNGRSLMISTTDPRTGVVRKPGVLTAPLLLGRLVAALNHERTGVRGAPVTVPPLGGGRVLLAEDNDVNRTVFRRMIQLLGVECDTVPDGSAAIDAALGEPPYDLVLMDLQMPRTDGLEATRRIRATGSATPIVALTATALHGDRERCLEAGMNGHLSKPITLPELRAALEPYLSPDPAPADPPDPGAEPAQDDPVDLSKLHELEEQLDDRALVVTTVNTYLGQLDLRRAAMAEALRDRDHDALRAAAHTLKSSSALLGAGPLAEACAQLERSATARSTETELTALVADVESAVAGAMRLMAGYLAADERIECAAQR